MISNSDGYALSRRRFLQAALAVGGATALLPSWMQEMAANAWLSGPADLDIVFALPASQRWQRAADLIGINLQSISHQVGHA